MKQQESTKAAILAECANRRETPASTPQPSSDACRLSGVEGCAGRQLRPPQSLQLMRFGGCTIPVLLSWPGKITVSDEGSMSGTKAIWVDAFHLELYGVRVQGWYAFDETHKPVMGPFPTREECEHEIAMAERGSP